MRERLKIIFLFFLSWVAISELNYLNKAGGEESYFPSFGKGLIKVRLYTDYFCTPCREMEPSIESLLLDLVKEGAIELTFVDVPISQHTILYANYFLFSLGARNDIDSAIAARRALFEAAEKRITEGGRLVGFLKEKGVRFKAVDPYPVFSLWNHYLQEDKIQSTPTCVIIDGSKKQTYRGNLDVPQAIEKLKNKPSPDPDHSLKEKAGEKIDDSLPRESE